MLDTPISSSSTALPEQTLPAAAISTELPLDQVELDEDLDEAELIIEDFTIDGICGVY